MFFVDVISCYYISVFTEILIYWFLLTFCLCSLSLICYNCERQNVFFKNFDHCMILFTLFQHLLVNFLIICTQSPRLMFILSSYVINRYFTTITANSLPLDVFLIYTLFVYVSVMLFTFVIFFFCYCYTMFLHYKMYFIFCYFSVPHASILVQKFTCCAVSMRPFWVEHYLHHVSKLLLSE